MSYHPPSLSVLASYDWTISRHSMPTGHLKRSISREVFTIELLGRRANEDAMIIGSTHSSWWYSA